MKKILLHTSLSVLAATMITGCFNHEEIVTDTSVTKIFTDTVVENLEYTCLDGSARKLTNAAGEFTCNVGETVRFFVGDIELGAITASTSTPTEVSPYTLSTDNTVAVNIAQLLQSLDPTGTADGVITIDENLSSNFDGSTITVDSPTFDTDANTTLGGTLVPESDAEDHLIHNAPDITPPVVTLEGNATVSIREGSTYTDAGATAEDTKDGPLTASTSDTVDTNTIGTYTITYTATDAAGNVGTAVRTVNVVANIAPVVTLNGASSITIRQNDTYTELGATANDAEDGNVTASIVITGGPVDTANPAEYTLVYTATDAEGKTGTAERVVTVVTDNPPVVTLVGANPVTRFDSDGAYVDAGANATDDFYADVNSTLTPTDNVTPNVAGTYTYVWTATDDASQEGSATRTVNVIEDVAPVVTLTGNTTLTCGLIGGAYTDPGATAQDDKDGSLTPTQSGTVDLGTAGTYTVQWSATDSIGQSGTADRTVEVKCFNTNPITGGCEDSIATNPCQ